MVFLDEALDQNTKRVRDRLACPHCAAVLSKDNLQRSFHTRVDPAADEPWKRVRFRPVLIDYSVADVRCEKAPDRADLGNLDRIEHQTARDI